MPEPFFCPVPAGFDMILEFLGQVDIWGDEITAMY